MISSLSSRQVMTTHAATVSKTRPGLTIKKYKPRGANRWLTAIRGSRVMISTVSSLFARYRPAAHAMQRTVHRRPGRSAHFFRGVLIGLAILMAIWLVIG
jgi:hypothetical protein